MARNAFAVPVVVVITETGATQTYFWAYGETTAYGGATPDRTIAIADGQAHPVYEPSSGLTPGTTYHFKVCASDEEENPPRVNCSKDKTARTPSIRKPAP